MNVDTGELVRLRAGQGKEGFIQVPNELEKEVEKQLNGKDSVMVDMSKDTPLVNWAKSHRTDKKKSRAKIAKASRRKNRS